MHSVRYACLLRQITQNRYNRQHYLDNYRRRNRSDRLFYMSGCIRVGWFLKKSLLLAQIYFSSLRIWHAQDKLSKLLSRTNSTMSRGFSCSVYPPKKTVVLLRLLSVKFQLLYLFLHIGAR